MSDFEKRLKSVETTLVDTEHFDKRLRELELMLIEMEEDLKKNSILSIVTGAVVILALWKVLG